MSQEPASDINISKVPVSGIAGLGMVVMAAAVAVALPQLRWFAMGALVGGVVIGLSLIAARNRRARQGAMLGASIVILAVAVGFLLYLRMR